MLGAPFFDCVRRPNPKTNADPLLWLAGSVSRSVFEPGAAERPSLRRRHVGLGPGLVDEDQALGRDTVLILDPLGRLL